MLNNNKINVHFSNGENITSYKNEKISSILKRLKNVPDHLFAVKVDNEEHKLDYQVIEDCNVSFITYFDEEGEKIYAKSLKFIMLMAFKLIYPEARVKIGNKISRAYYIKVNGIEVNDYMVQNVKEKMNEIISQDLFIEKEKPSYRRLKQIYIEMDSMSQLENFKIKLSDTYTIYKCNGYYNYLYGRLVPKTGNIKGFDLGIYKDSLVLMLPKKDNIYTVDKKIKNSKILDTTKDFNHFLDIIGIPNVSCLNNAVLSGTIDNIIRIAEADQSRRLEECVSKIKRRKRVKAIYICGPSSSSKTTFAQRLAEQLRVSGIKSFIISMDNYFNDEENIPFDKDGKKDYECFENIDFQLFSRQIQKLLSYNKVNMPHYDFTINKKLFDKYPTKLEGGELLIIEGIHALNPKLSEIIADEKTFKIYVAPIVTLSYDLYTGVSSNDTRLLRRLVRDSQSRGNSPENTLKMWAKVREGEEKNIFPYVNKSDYIFNTSLVYEIGVLKLFAEPMLLQISDESEFYSDARRLYKMLQNFRFIQTDQIPSNSVIKEFIGKGCFYR
ncbi:MAG: hypothetical protein RSB67_02925 [Clostridia bacterium]